MPNVRSQTITDDSLTIVASDGRTYSVTRLEILANYALQTGTPPQRKQKCIDWVKESVEAALGAEQVPASLINLDVSDVTGKVTTCQLLSEPL